MVRSSLCGLRGTLLCSVHISVYVSARVCSHVLCAVLLQWTEHGRSGANGRPVAPSVPIGAAVSAWHPRPRTEAETAVGLCLTPRTAPMGCACKVSTQDGGAREGGGALEPDKETPPPRPHSVPSLQWSSPLGPVPTHHIYHFIRTIPHHLLYHLCHCLSLYFPRQIRKL